MGWLALGTPGIVKATGPFPSWMTQYQVPLRIVAGARQCGRVPLRATIVIVPLYTGVVSDGTGLGAGPGVTVRSV